MLIVSYALPVRLSNIHFRIAEQVECNKWEFSACYLRISCDFWIFLSSCYTYPSPSRFSCWFLFRIYRRGWWIAILFLYVSDIRSSLILTWKIYQFNSIQFNSSFIKPSTTAMDTKTQQSKSTSTNQSEADTANKLKYTHKHKWIRKCKIKHAYYVRKYEYNIISVYYELLEIFKVVY